MTAAPAPEWVGLLRAARRAAVPIVAVSTADPAAWVRRAASEVFRAESCLVVSDCVRGLVGVNARGRDWLAEVLSAREAEASASPFGAVAAPGKVGTSILEGAELCGLLPGDPDGGETGGVWCVVDADAFLSGDANNLPSVRAILNLRDAFKSTGRMVVLLGPDFAELAPRLQADTLLLVDPLPDAAEIGEIVSGVCGDAESAGLIPAGWSDAIPDAGGSLRGLNRFASEQQTAIALVSDRALRPGTLQRSRARQIRSVRGVIPEWGSETFADLGGQARVQWWADTIMRSEARPSVVARMEELEKALAGATGGAGDGGVAADSLGVLLQAFEDLGWSGLVALGPGGSGKSGFSKALGATYDLPCYRLDIGATRDRWVGSSEARIRALVDTIQAIGASRVFVVASCNSIVGVPGPLLRRFTGGLWFFDLPSPSVRRDIWAKQGRALGVDVSDVPAEFLARPYSGAEIRNVIRNRRDYAIGWDDAASVITPLYLSDATTIAKLRADARGRYLDASKPGPYLGPEDGPGADAAASVDLSSGRRSFGVGGV